MPTTAIPAEKYAALKAAYPEDFSCFFAGSELNFVGKMAEKLLNAEKLLASGTFVFNVEKEEMVLAVPAFCAPRETKNDMLKDLAAEHMQNRFGIKGAEIRMLFANERTF